MSKLLLDEQPLIILPTLAKVVGLSEAVFLQQLNYRLLTSGVEKNGRLWLRASYPELSRLISGIWASATVRRTVDGLEKKNIVISGQFNEKGSDRSKWYSINRDALDRALDGVSSAEFDRSSAQNEHTYPAQNEQTPPAQNEQMSNNIIQQKNTFTGGKVPPAGNDTSEGIDKKKEIPPERQFLAWWGERYKAIFGETYFCNFSTETNKVKTLLRAFGMENLQKRAEKFFSDDNKFVADSGRTISMFYVKVNSYGGATNQGTRNVTVIQSGKKYRCECGADIPESQRFAHNAVCSVNKPIDPKAAAEILRNARTGVHG